MPESQQTNPTNQLFKVPFLEVLNSVILNQAITSTILQLQIRNISNLEGKDIEDVRKEVSKIFEVEA